MKVAIDRDLCIGCGLCAQICRAVFAFEPSEPASYVRSDGDLVRDRREVTFAHEYEEKVLRAARECPAEAIFLTDDDGHPIEVFELGSSVPSVDDHLRP